MVNRVMPSYAHSLVFNTGGIRLFPLGTWYTSKCIIVLKDIRYQHKTFIFHGDNNIYGLSKKETVRIGLNLLSTNTKLFKSAISQSTKLTFHRSQGPSLCGKKRQDKKNNIYLTLTAVIFIQKISLFLASGACACILAFTAVLRTCCKDIQNRI